MDRHVSGSAMARHRFAASVLGLTPTEPSAFVAAAVVLLLAAGFGSVLPARRATEVHPIEVLRSE